MNLRTEIREFRAAAARDLRRRSDARLQHLADLHDKATRDWQLTHDEATEFVNGLAATDLTRAVARLQRAIADAIRP